MKQLVVLLLLALGLVHGQEKGDKTVADLFKDELECAILQAQGKVRTDSQGKPVPCTRAPSSYQNCNCQCDSYQVRKNNQLLGNCVTPDSNGVLFCYIKGDAVCSCRDAQPSSFLTDPTTNKPRLFSYEACTTAARNQCRNQGLLDNNLGPSNFPHCSLADWKKLWPSVPITQPNPTRTPVITQPPRTTRRPVAQPLKKDENRQCPGFVPTQIRAPSQYGNCNCQCDNFSWTFFGNFGNYVMGNCASTYKGIKFCYVSGNALCSCKDIQPSTAQPGKFISFEACTKPPHNPQQRCNTGGVDNSNPKDFPHCQNSQVFCANHGFGSFTPRTPQVVNKVFLDNQKHNFNCIADL